MLVKNGEISENQWTHLNTEAIPNNGAITLPLDRWIAEQQQIAGRTAPLGVRLLPDSNLADISNHLADLQLIVIEFPVLADGRVFSFAKLLRRNGYQGEIRAIGNFVSDQMYYLQRVGVNSFEVPESISEQTIHETLNRFSVSYQ
jgi:uncharacterized protein (DUF934 family)